MKKESLKLIKRNVIWCLIKNKSKHLYSFITKKYSNYIRSIINNYLFKCGLSENVYIEKDILFHETIESVFKIKEEKFQKWDLKTLIGHSAVFTTSKFIRHFNTTKQKVSLLCGNQTENLFNESQRISDPLTQNYFDNINVKNTIESIINITLNEKEKKNKILRNTIYLKLCGESNTSISKKIQTPRRKVYDYYNKWFNKNKEKVLNLLCLT